MKKIRVIKIKQYLVDYKMIKSFEWLNLIQAMSSLAASIICLIQIPFLWDRLINEQMDNLMAMMVSNLRCWCCPCTLATPEQLHVCVCCWPFRRWGGAYGNLIHCANISVRPWHYIRADTRLLCPPYPKIIHPNIFNSLELVTIKVALVSIMDLEKNCHTSFV